ncbi:MAG: transcriptional regulator [Parcubacteria group bacterium GW2011_GWF2_38_76]|nr:MAG: transcriptional regulator [Parcubacteria group bacterium GW2011_GWF2_38_76]HBM46162.1 YebC/PmpR family DNA-binding transcriptional regulator [Patescibacteria group bacterium]
MSGHNKWSKIKNQKGADDAKKSKVFAMLSKKITVESKLAKGDKNNPSLRKAIEKAREANMPNDKIDGAVAKGTGVGGAEMTEVRYEAYGPGGAAIIVEGITDNKNRMSPEMKHIISDAGGTFGAEGSVIWAFDKVEGEWVAKMPMEVSETDKVALEKLLEKIDNHEDVENIYTNVSNLG